MGNEVLEELGISLDVEGFVSVGNYEQAKCRIEEARQATLDAAPSLEERDRIAKAWPLQDGKICLTAEPCC
ncbi:hypothetical protein NM688_g4320 [Phlebia brevispora]|uniref:Uncharacterized protein n=1 Tax=Phlebia brevispora TaxID=194682 RepID=A0ACC1T394_9APHY|nr:hypothetical protein NM688_g4320 [Phlebia brevispora]